MTQKREFPTPGAIQPPLREFRTSDGVTLRYRSVGHGTPLVLLHGWSQSASMFTYQMDALQTRYQVIALDFRGHGESEKTHRGLRIPRLARDVDELLQHIRVTKAHFLGWSMGASVLWSFVDLFGTDVIDRLILVDQPPMLTIWPETTPTEREEGGALFTLAQLETLCEALRGPDGESMRAQFLSGMVTKSISPQLFEWILSQNTLTPLSIASSLLWSHCSQDWRDILPRIDRSTLVIAGAVSHVNPASQYFIQRQIPGAQIRKFAADEGGAHFMFLEAPALFNAVCDAFLAGGSVK